MLHLRSRPAESMIESLIAITVIILASAASMSMLRSSVQGNNVIGEKLIAIELAVEGLDAIENIRDTNYLMFSSEADACWNKLGAEVPDDCLSGAADTIMDGENYYLYQDFSSSPFNRWTLIPIDNPNDGKMDLFQFDLGDGESVELYSDSGQRDTDGFTPLESSVFTRRVHIEVIDPNSFQAFVTVSWRLGSLTQEVTLSRIISHIF